MSDPITLRSEDHLATVSTTGGRLLSFARRHAGREVAILCGAPASFPLVPWSNRIRAGRFAFAGHEVRLPLNSADGCHAIHGHGCYRPWTVTERSERTLTLSYVHEAGSWPWSYEARQIVALDAAGLGLELRVRNLDGSAMPVGLGFHPYFPRAGEARLTAAVRSVWLVDDEVMPIRNVELPAKWDLPVGVAVAALACDNGFDGWNGLATIEWPRTGLGARITAGAPLTHLVVFAPDGEGFFCVEPVSHMTDAFNRAAAGEEETGMIALLPGQQIAAAMRIEPFALRTDRE